MSLNMTIGIIVLERLFFIEMNTFLINYIQIQSVGINLNLSGFVPKRKMKNSQFLQAAWVYCHLFSQLISSPVPLVSIGQCQHLTWYHSGAQNWFHLQINIQIK